MELTSASQKPSKHLVLLGCSGTKFSDACTLPALARYDGPMFRVFNAYLRESGWSPDLSVGILSAEYGLIGGLAQIDYYDRRMHKARAEVLSAAATETLLSWSKTHDRITLVMGRDYLPALKLGALDDRKVECQVIQGGIGEKLGALHRLLRTLGKAKAAGSPSYQPGRPLYFLPDWDDMLDSEFDFKRDRFSRSIRGERNEKHCNELMSPGRLCDGILVSLAQRHVNKGVLRQVSDRDEDSLAPRSIRETFGLQSDQLAFGDCGAYSYVAETEPSLSPAQAVSLYQIYGFDLGASVDHIPVPEFSNHNGRFSLTQHQRRQRVRITKENAAEFIRIHRERRCGFVPVGVIQSIGSRGYASQLPEYVEMGYRFVALGGLVPRSDTDILKILNSVEKARKKLPRRIADNVWIHLFGIFRPRIQSAIRKMNISSFDSASYFRKAWLRSSQNYLGNNGRWYAAIRVPMTTDPRTMKRLKTGGLEIAQLAELEKNALTALTRFGKRRQSMQSTLQAILEYDQHLSRSAVDEALVERYRRTLGDRPWEHCSCAICQDIGIHALIFRGSNRNKRRGAHNTQRLYNLVCSSENAGIKGAGTE
jgi:hypothetical protein